LNVINIELPTLNERKEDVEILAEHFMRKEESEMSFSKAVISKLVENEWKGNVRELESAVKRAVIFAKSDSRNLIKLKDLPENLAKFDKDELESMIIDSLRDKKFSHSSVNETAKELGGLNRTVISENFRGYFFKVYLQNNFDLNLAVKEIANNEDEEILSKVESKITTYLTNIEKDLAKLENESFDEIKKKFVSKYKNLPQKYHIYFDSIIKQMMKK
jgi:DNA-binding NtrC family response regulator